MIPTVALLGTRYPDLSIEEQVLGPAGVAVVRADGSDREALTEVAGADVVICGSRVQIDRDAIDSLATHGIVRAGIGFERVDVAAATALGIPVSNVPDYGTESVAQHALAMALAGCRRLLEADRVVRRGDWGFSDLVPMHIPATQTAGVLGLGRIGRRVAELFAAVGFGRVVGHDPVAQAGGAEQIDFHGLLEESDVLSLHIPGGGAPVMGAAEFARMKPGSVLVNTARGSLIDEEALCAALDAGRPRVACLDVFEREPADLGIFGDAQDRVIASPHQAWYTEESQADLRRKSAEEALRILRRQPRHYPVNNLETLQ